MHQPDMVTFEQRVCQAHGCTHILNRWQLSSIQRTGTRLLARACLAAFNAFAQAHPARHTLRAGFVAQTAAVIGGRQAPLSPLQRPEAEKSVPLEVTDAVQHHAGTLSMARSSDPNSGTSSFSILLGDAPHLNMQVRSMFTKPALQRLRSTSVN